MAGEAPERGGGNPPDQAGAPEGAGEVARELRAVPEDILRLVGEREAARAARDFALADALRERIRQAGYRVVDTPSGPEVAPAPAARPEGPRRLHPHEVESVLDRPALFDASVQWVARGWPEDVVRGIASFRAHQGALRVQHVVVDVLEADPQPPWPREVEVLRLVPGTGWGAARNAGVRRALGEVVVLVDGSVEATGDALGPLLERLRDPTVGVTGPFGLVTADLREFAQSPGPEVDAVQGYLLAFRRDLARAGLQFDEGFRFYRHADLDLSFRARAMGLRGVVTEVPVRRHAHREWEATPEPERTRLSRRNFYRFLDRWRGRTDLLVGGGTGGDSGSGPR